MAKKKKAPEGNQDTRSEVREYVLERWQAFDGEPEQYPWIWEGDRWNELMFCLIARLGTPDFQADMARSLTDILSRLGLLKVETLAQLAGGHGASDASHSDAVFMIQLFERAGAQPKRAQAIVTTLYQAAVGLQQGHAGKVQQYLRNYGQQILDDVGDTFSFSELSEEDARYAFTHWLQNAVNMPLARSDPIVDQLCKDRGISIEQLVAVADELDLNLALLDDILAGSWGDEPSDDHNA